MRFDPQRLTFLALCILDEAAAASYRAPVQRTLAIRLALAYLYAVGRGEHELFEGFWTELANPQSHSPSPTQAGHMRGTSVRANLYAISRSVGYPQTPDAWQKLSNSWRSKQAGPKTL